MALRAHRKVSLIFQSVIPLVPNQIARLLATAQESVKIENVWSLGILCGAREMASNLAQVLSGQSFIPSCHWGWMPDAAQWTPWP